ncbi:MAG: polymer-forming cytoskeletal protein [Desulfobacterales bacterium]|nr:MAG: polymer-forming cytoskeletal protein [Desulfobacterales bacterium]
MERGNLAGSTSTLSHNVKIEGEIHGEESLEVEGFIKGSIKLGGNIIIGKSGVVEADVEANSVVIHGKLSGNVLARQQLEIQPTGQLIGDCTARSINIQEGAIFEGRSNMIKPTSVPRDPGAATKSPAVSPKNETLNIATQTGS